MRALPTAPAATDGSGTHTQPSQTPVLITEHEVAFSTSAAASIPHTATTRGWRDAPDIIGAALRRMFVSATSNPPARRHYPKHYSYLERALMGREMDRL